jgi:hypothetical protein
MAPSAVARHRLGAYVRYHPLQRRRLRTQSSLRSRNPRQHLTAILPRRQYPAVRHFNLTACRAVPPPCQPPRQHQPRKSTPHAIPVQHTPHRLLRHPTSTRFERRQQHPLVMRMANHPADMSPWLACSLLRYKACRASLVTSIRQISRIKSVSQSLSVYERLLRHSTQSRA